MCLEYCVHRGSREWPFRNPSFTRLIDNFLLGEPSSLFALFGTADGRLNIDRCVGTSNSRQNDWPTFSRTQAICNVPVICLPQVILNYRFTSVFRGNSFAFSRCLSYANCSQWFSRPFSNSSKSTPGIPWIPESSQTVSAFRSRAMPCFSWDIFLTVAVQLAILVEMTVLSIFAHSLYQTPSKRPGEYY